MEIIIRKEGKYSTASRTTKPEGVEEIWIFGCPQGKADSDLWDSLIGPVVEELDPNMVHRVYEPVKEEETIRESLNVEPEPEPEPTKEKGKKGKGHKDADTD